MTANPLLYLCLNISLFAFSMLRLFKQYSGPSPIFDRLDINMITKRMNATLLPSANDEIFRNEPGPEVDQAWRRISNERPIAITREEVIAIGKDPEKAVRFPENFGLGEAYAGRIDVFHQIHCLDALRREAYFDHYHGSKHSGFNSTTKLHKVHLSHCVYYLLQNIMCQANVDVYTHVWTDTVLQPFPDFQINHQCKDFNGVLNWQEHNSVDLHEFYKIRKSESFGPAMKMSTEFKELWNEFEFFNHEGDHGNSEGGQIG
ncbi:hypothetical protein C7974DRAFT_437225 [Boeremia exigua]|uniref:uncharacterized protein n=1 Tax=Boeremia exigua TaxID=749465 RepID=UPI001E8CD62B|nr:uncharacterized protein C7974DRAFT_437225 [Boeremia exigua]KAH6613837.1 hypothetical protein C7974DRAFT_437225 [Boeremia exigua]